MAAGNSIHFTSAVFMSNKYQHIVEKRNPNGQETVYAKRLHTVGHRWHECFPQTKIFLSKYPLLIKCICNCIEYFSCTASKVMNDCKRIAKATVASMLILFCRSGQDFTGRF